MELELKRIGALLREARLSSGHTFVEIAEQTGISHNTVYRVEAGFDFKMSTLISLLDLYGINYGYLDDEEERDAKD